MIKDHEKRLVKLESMFESKPSLKGALSKQTLPAHLLALRTEGYFSTARTAQEVHEKISPKYPCDIDRIMMALFRLSKNRELRKVSKSVDGNKVKAYVS